MERIEKGYLFYEIVSNDIDEAILKTKKIQQAHPDDEPIVYVKVVDLHSILNDVLSCLKLNY